MSDDDCNSPHNNLSIMLPQQSPEPSAEECDFLQASLSNSVTATLVKAGPAGISAASAILSGRSKRKPYSFETNPCMRKRLNTRLIKKLRHTLEEFASRVGQQAVILVVNPIDGNRNFKVFGTKPLLDIARNLQTVILEDLQTSLTKRSPPQIDSDPSLYPLPPLDIDGIPTPVEKMTQAQLRAFIPYMLRYSTLRGKPGWGRENTKPVWWPKDLPWANVRMDVRSEAEKQRVPWTHALRKVVSNCYIYHGREDLLPSYVENTKSHAKNDIAVKELPMNLHTLTNADGTVTIVQIDPSNSTITLPDGSIAKMEVMTEIPDSVEQSEMYDDKPYFTTSDRIVFTEGNEQMGEEGLSSTQNNGANIVQLTTNSDGVIYLTPITLVSSDNEETNTVETTNETNSSLTDVDDLPLQVCEMYTEIDEKPILPNIGNIK